ncbi:MAG: hypothetical protein LBE99_04035, partial [Puniceicoccales bacterium]|nr:hypothetical protein [Puniceicoccales bacterium]
ILAQYPPDKHPIIILHGDHGRSTRFVPTKDWEIQQKNDQKLSLHIRAHWGNLLAIHGLRLQGNENITLVNLYRLIFNKLFDEHNMFLKDRYFSFTDPWIKYTQL